MRLDNTNDRYQEGTKRVTPNRILFIWFWKGYVRQNAVILFFALVFMAIEGGMMGLLSYSVKSLFDSVFLSGNTKNIILVGLGIFSIFSLRAISGFIQGLLTSHAAQKVNKQLQLNLTTHLLTLDSQYFYKNPPGLLIERVRVDTQKITDMSTVILMALGRDGISLISLLAVAFIIDWRWAVIAFIATPILIVPILFLQFWIRRIASKSRAIEALLSVRLDEIFHGIKEIKLNAIETHELGRFEKTLESMRKAKFRIDAGTAAMPAMIDIIAAIGFFGVMFYGGSEIISGEKTIGEFMSFFTAMALIFEPLRRLSNISGNAQVVFASIDRIYNIFVNRPTIESKKRSGHLPLQSFQKGVNLSFNNVNFFYGKKRILNNLSFNSNAGTTTAIVGRSGAGKTTIFNLISRLIEPSNGLIRFNETGIFDLSLTDLRSLISVVSQESLLFDDSIRSNILVGKLDATIKEVEKVVKASLVSEFVNELPNGIETFVGPRGANLSGGQRQRILIARAMLRDTPVLLLDEPTSALDSKSELLVQSALSRLSEGKTTLIIAHRISTIANAENILVVKNGVILESGVHDELIKKNGAYTELANAQLLSSDSNHTD